MSKYNDSQFKVLDLLSNAKYDEALAALAELVLASKDKELINSFTLASSKFKNLQKSNTLGLIDPGHFRVEHTQIIHLLIFINSSLIEVEANQINSDATAQKEIKEVISAKLNNSEVIKSAYQDNESTIRKYPEVFKGVAALFKNQNFWKNLTNEQSSKFNEDIKSLVKVHAGLQILSFILVKFEEKETGKYDEKKMLKKVVTETHRDIGLSEIQDSLKYLIDLIKHYDKYGFSTTFIQGLNINIKPKDAEKKATTNSNESLIMYNDIKSYIKRNEGKGLFQIISTDAVFGTFAAYAFSVAIIILLFVLVFRLT